MLKYIISKSFKGVFIKTLYLSFEKLIVTFLETFKRFPLALLSAYFFTWLVIYFMEIDKKPDAILLKIAFVLELGFFLFIVARLIKKEIFCIIAAILLILYFIYLPDFDKDIGIVVLKRHIIINILFFITIFWIYFWDKDPSNSKFWGYANGVMFAFILSIIFTIVLQIGLSIAIFAVDRLFLLEILPRRYAQMFIFLSGFFGTTYFLSWIPKEGDNCDLKKTRLNEVFTKYILTPLTFVYLLILYTYSAKVIINWSFPKGILAWIILLFSFVLVLTYLSWTPFWSEKTKRFKKLFPLALVFQTFMLEMSIKIRVDEYGWTENRYMIAMFGVWLFFISLYYLVSKDARHKWLFVSLSFVILVTQVGPFNAYKISKISQHDRLKLALDKHKPLSDRSDIKIRYNISSKIEYLSRRFSRESIRDIMPNIVQKSYDKNISKYEFASFATKELGFLYVNRYQYKNGTSKDESFNMFVPNLSLRLKVKGFDFLEEVRFFDRLAIPDRDKDSIKLTDSELLVYKDAKLISKIDLRDFLQNIIKDKSLSNANFNPQADSESYKKLIYIFEDDRVKLKFFLREILTNRDGKILNLSGRVLYKLK